VLDLPMARDGNTGHHAPKPSVSNWIGTETHLDFPCFTFNIERNRTKVGSVIIANISHVY